MSLETNKKSETNSNVRNEKKNKNSAPNSVDLTEESAACKNLSGGLEQQNAEPNISRSKENLPESNVAEYSSNNSETNLIKEIHEHDESTKDFDWLSEIKEQDEVYLKSCLDELEDDKLQVIMEEINECNSCLSMENDIYEFILHEDETVLSTLEMVEMDQDQSSLQDSLMSLTYSEKCYFANQKIQRIEEECTLKEAGFNHQIQSLKFNVKSLDISLKELMEEKEKFDNLIREGKHPVTKKFILQKVLKYFDDSIRNKMEKSNKLKVQIQHDIMKQNKFLDQVKTKQKRLASLSITEFQEAEFAHKNAYAQLTNCKDQLARCKTRLSPFIQSMAEMKKELEKEKEAMDNMKSAVLKQEHLKELMLTQKARNNQRLAELEAALRKIRLDPRRHNLPQVIDYAAVKRENAALKKHIKMWKKKVDLAEQSNILHLNALKKKTM